MLKWICRKLVHALLAVIRKAETQHMPLIYEKTREVNSPETRPGDAGIDFFLPTFTKEYLLELTTLNGFSKSHYLSNVKTDQEEIYLTKGTIIKFPLGVKLNFDHTIYGNISLVAFDKSGVSTKLGLMTVAPVIDKSYTGEIHACFYVTKDTPIQSGQKIIQFLPMSLPDCVNITKGNVERNTTRGEGGFGSTGT